MQRGTIKKIVHRKGGGGYAFITREGKPDIYIDRATLGSAVFKSLAVGDVLSFKLVETRKGPRAEEPLIVQRARRVMEEKPKR